LVTFLLPFVRMGSTTALPPQGEQIQVGGSGDGVGAGQALIPARHERESGVAIPSNGVAARLPVEVDVGVPVRDFRVRNLLTLAPGLVVESQWGHGEDVPLASGDVQLAWTEFEVIETQLAVRLTRLA
jgi:hypothetical protein